MKYLDENLVARYKDQETWELLEPTGLLFLEGSFEIIDSQPNIKGTLVPSYNERFGISRTPAVEGTTYVDYLVATFNENGRNAPIRISHFLRRSPRLKERIDGFFDAANVMNRISMKVFNFLPDNAQSVFVWNRGG